MWMKTTIPKEGEIQREWLLVDATDRTLGRLAVNIANALRGRRKPTFTPHVDTGDFVIVVNAEKVRLSGKKDEQKIYARYSGWRGGLKEISVASMRQRHPDRIIRLAVRGMLPKTHMSQTIIKRLMVYAGGEHPHAAQKPRTVEM